MVVSSRHLHRRLFCLFHASDLHAWFCVSLRFYTSYQQICVRRCWQICEILRTRSLYRVVWCVTLFTVWSLWTSACCRHTSSWAIASDTLSLYSRLIIYIFHILASFVLADKFVADHMRRIETESYISASYTFACIDVSYFDVCRIGRQVRGRSHPAC